MKKGSPHLILVILLLVLASGVMFFSKRGADNLSTSAPDSPKRTIAPPKAGFDTLRREEGKRGPRDRTWRHAKGVPCAENPEPVESPVFLGFLQSDPSNTKLRIGLRQESGGQVDASDLTVSVDLLDAEGQNLGEANKVSTEGQMKDGSFEESPAPILRVDSEESVTSVRVSLSYKGQATEQRSYTLEGR